MKEKVIIVSFVLIFSLSMNNFLNTVIKNPINSVILDKKIMNNNIPYHVSKIES